MNPIYKFQLSAGQDTRQAFPVYKDDLAIDYALEQNQEFYRGKLSGKLTFQRDDYAFIRSKSFDTQFDVVIYISYNGGQTWAVYWSGQFWKTDCQFNEDDQTVIVTPTVNDRYNAVLAGMEKEYNLIDLAPVMQSVKLDKRPMIQVYVPGQTVIGCFLSGMWWEQECKAVNESDTVEITIDGHDYTFPAITYKYHFAINKKNRILDISQTGTPILPDFAMGGSDLNPYYNISTGGFTFSARYDDTTEPDNPFNIWEIIRDSDNVTLWHFKSYAVEPNMPYSVTLTPVDGSGATGNVSLYVHDLSVYARYVTDIKNALGLTAYEIPDDDMVKNNRNYHYVFGYDFPDTIFFSSRLTTTPTKWGLYQPGQYYREPYTYWNQEFYPVARAGWGRISIWFIFEFYDEIIETPWRKEYAIKDAYPIGAVIAVLLAKFAPNITHAETTAYSEFLYGTNPVSYIKQRLFITPKSNLIASGYDQPAQQAPITLKRVTDMLRDCFRCYWFIDENNRFRIEHISYFMNGGAYPRTPNYPVVGMDLTALKVTRNGKPWAYVRNQYQFDKPEMAARYQFGWMDDVTELFDGFPIDILSKYVNPDNIEQIDVSQFTSDVDYILLNPGDISKDGFVLLGARKLETFGDIEFEQGSIHGIIGQSYEQNKFYSDTRIRTKLLFPNSQQINISIQSGYKYNIMFFDADKILIRSTGFQTSNQTFQINGATYLAIIIAKNADTDITPSESVNGSVGGLACVLPYVNFQYNDSDHILQNAWVAFAYLQRYYMYDMPARNVSINGVQQIVQGIKKLKTQTIKFPVLTEPNLTNLIKTELGNGVIQKMSVNLSSRNANTTLKYDTE